MTNEEIIEMVREAGGYSPEKYPDEWRLDVDDLLRFAKLVAEKEREECAQTVLNIAGFKEYEFAANSIRARGDSK